MTMDIIWRITPATRWVWTIYLGGKAWSIPSKKGTPMPVTSKALTIATARALLGSSATYEGVD